MASGDAHSLRLGSRRVCLSRLGPLTGGYRPAMGWGLQGPVPARRRLGGTEQGEAACAAPLRGVGKGGGGGARERGRWAGQWNEGGGSGQPRPIPQAAAQASNHRARQAWVPRPLVFHPGPQASRRSLGVCELSLPDGPTQLFLLAPFQLVIAAVIHHWTPPQFNPLAPVRGKGRGEGGG